MRQQIKPVLCVGDLVVDIITSPVTQIPLPGGSVITDSISIAPGGNSLNTAVALCRMGDQVSVGGSIGDDDLGKLLLQHLEGIGLDVKGVVEENGETTASTVIFRADGEDRRYIMDLGVGKNFTGRHLSQDLIPEDGVVLVGGYLKLEAWDDHVLIEFLKEARRKKNKTVLNVCLVQNSDVDVSRVVPLLEYIDIFLPNEDEARIITGKSAIEDQAKMLLSSGAKNIVITRGDQGLYASNGKSGFYLSAYEVNIVDPSGCGDCFTAGMIAGIRRDWDIIKTLKYGSASGALGATALGCTAGIPKHRKIDEFIELNIMDLSQVEID